MILQDHSDTTHLEAARSIARGAKQFYDELHRDEHGRFRSWEHCYLAFHAARNCRKPDIDYLCLHLAFYLASWGMYRGSSFLIQKDYQAHEGIVRLLMDKRYHVLWDIRCCDYLYENNCNLLDELNEKIRLEYGVVRKSVKGEINSDISSTLITKVLMGTMGCVPAYDQYFVKGMRNLGIASGKFGSKSIIEVSKFYVNYEKIFENVRHKIQFTGRDMLYPQMKILDMGMWQYGSGDK